MPQRQSRLAIALLGLASLAAAPLILAEPASSQPIVVGGTPKRPNFAASPAIRFGRAAVCRDVSSSYFGGFVDLGKSFSQPPIFVGTIDESLNDSGASWSRIRRWNDNRVGVRCNDRSDGFDWMAIEPGVHKVSNKTIIAGREPNMISNGTVFFPQAFSTPPVVLLFIDESGNDNGGTTVRLTGTPATTGFQVWLNNPVDAVHWVAMDPGNYSLGLHRWNAETVPGLSTGATFAFPTAKQTLPGILMTVHDTNNSGATSVRLVNQDNQSFQVWADNAAELLHYVAFETIQ